METLIVGIILGCILVSIIAVMWLVFTKDLGKHFLGDGWTRKGK